MRFLSTLQQRRDLILRYSISIACGGLCYMQVALFYPAQANEQAIEQADFIDHAALEPTPDFAKATTPLGASVTQLVLQESEAVTQSPNTTSSSSSLPSQIQQEPKLSELNERLPQQQSETALDQTDSEQTAYMPGTNLSAPIAIPVLTQKSVIAENLGQTQTEPVKYLQKRPFLQHNMSLHQALRQNTQWFELKRCKICKGLNAIKFLAYLVQNPNASHKVRSTRAQLCLFFIQTLLHRQPPYLYHTESLDQALHFNSSHADTTRRVLKLYREVLKEQIYLDLTSDLQLQDYTKNSTRSDLPKPTFTPVLGFAGLRAPFYRAERLTPYAQIQFVLEHKDYLDGIRSKRDESILEFTDEMVDAIYHMFIDGALAFVLLPSPDLKAVSTAELTAQGAIALDNSEQVAFSLADQQSSAVMAFAAQAESEPELIRSKHEKVQVAEHGIVNYLTVRRDQHDHAYHVQHMKQLQQVAAAAAAQASASSSSSSSAPVPADVEANVDAAHVKGRQAAFLPEQTSEASEQDEAAEAKLISERAVKPEAKLISETAIESEAQPNSEPAVKSAPLPVDGDVFPHAAVNAVEPVRTVDIKPLSSKEATLAEPVANESAKADTLAALASDALSDASAASTNLRLHHAVNSLQYQSLKLPSETELFDVEVGAKHVEQKVQLHSNPWYKLHFELTEPLSSDAQMLNEGRCGNFDSAKFPAQRTEQDASLVALAHTSNKPVSLQTVTSQTLENGEKVEVASQAKVEATPQVKVAAKDPADVDLERAESTSRDASAQNAQSFSNADVAPVANLAQSATLASHNSLKTRDETDFNAKLALDHSVLQKGVVLDSSWDITDQVMPASSQPQMQMKVKLNAPTIYPSLEESLDNEADLKNAQSQHNLEVFKRHIQASVSSLLCTISAFQTQVQTQKQPVEALNPLSFQELVRSKQSVALDPELNKAAPELNLQHSPARLHVEPQLEQGDADAAGQTQGQDANAHESNPAVLSVPAQSSNKSEKAATKAKLPDSKSELKPASDNAEQGQGANAACSSKQMPQTQALGSKGTDKHSGQALGSVYVTPAQKSAPFFDSGDKQEGKLGTELLSAMDLTELRNLTYPAASHAASTQVATASGAGMQFLQNGVFKLDAKPYLPVDFPRFAVSLNAKQPLKRPAPRLFSFDATGHIYIHSWLQDSKLLHQLPLPQATTSANAYRNSKGYQLYLNWINQAHNRRYVHNQPRLKSPELVKAEKQKWRIMPQQRQSDLQASRDFLISMYQLVWLEQNRRYEHAVFIKGTQDRPYVQETDKISISNWNEYFDCSYLVDESADSFLSINQMMQLTFINYYYSQRQQAWLDQKFTLNKLNLEQFETEL